MAQHHAEKAQHYSESIKFDTDSATFDWGTANDDLDAELNILRSRRGMTIAIEQIAEALEERQRPDRRTNSEPIEFEDRRIAVRRASDLS